MINYLDDFVINRTAEEFYDLTMYDTWYEVESTFCEEMDLEPEIYED